MAQFFYLIFAFAISFISVVFGQYPPYGQSQQSNAYPYYGNGIPQSLPGSSMNNMQYSQNGGFQNGGFSPFGNGMPPQQQVIRGIIQLKMIPISISALSLSTISTSSIHGL